MLTWRARRLMQNSQLERIVGCECHVLRSVKPALGGLLHAWPAMVCMLPAAWTAHADRRSLSVKNT